MKDFIHTGWWAPTLTTPEDPMLKVIETDNGINWMMRFYVGNTLIDCINMEHLRGKEIDSMVKKLPVYSDENIYLGTVIQRLEDAYSVHTNEY
jgi:hypothetical protein